MFSPALRRRLASAHAVILFPPFGGLDRPALGPHILQACAREVGFEVTVLYANLLFAQRAGYSEYADISLANPSSLVGERMFARAAHGISPSLAGIQIERLSSGYPNAQSSSPSADTEAALAAVAAAAADFTTELADELAAICKGVVGVSSTFEQTNAAAALLTRIKSSQPQIVTLIGGANCQGAMAEGIAALIPAVDHVFVGESEVTFPQFLQSMASVRWPRVIKGKSCDNLDALPIPDFSDYYQQLADLGPDCPILESGDVSLPVESSRGCWWGQKSHCTFCGLNGETMGFRVKSAQRLIDELRILMRAHPTNSVVMVDNIMPHGYFKELLPLLPTELPGLHIFYEQKSNLSLTRVKALKDAGVVVIQPGIESLSTDLLRLMRKGVSAAQNLALMRYARALDVKITWNLLYAFPGDKREWLTAMRQLLPFIEHLEPPIALSHLSIDRFSPYFEQPQRHGVSNVRPIPAYFEVMPNNAPIDKIAYHFEATYATGTGAAVAEVEAMRQQILAWQAHWNDASSPRPVLEISKLDDELYLLIDTRSCASAEFSFITAAAAAVALLGKRAHAHPELERWALDRHVCVELDGELVPLCTAAYDLLAELEAGAALVQNRTLGHRWPARTGANLVLRAHQGQKR